METPIILASASPRRAQILAECGIPHKIMASHAREIMDPEKTAAYNALFNACLKARAVSRRVKKGFVIGADTVVLSGKKIIGKPRSKSEARRLLMEFSGRTIGVYTGLCVIDAAKGRQVKSVVASRVKVKKITPKMAGRFIKVAGPFDKAGGFSIEGPGSFIFDDVRGSFYNVLGLPMIELYRLFGELGIDLLKCCSS